MMLWDHLRHYIPSFRKLLRSLKLRSREFLRENTLHGFVYFVDPRRPLFERAIWFVCTVASLCAALGIIVVVWQRFQSIPTTIVIDIQTDIVSVIYPSVNLCMTSDYLNVTGISKDLANIYKAYYNWNWKPLNNSGIKLPVVFSKLFQDITPNCETLLTNCVMHELDVDCAILFTKYLTPAGICCKILSKKYKRYEKPPKLSFKWNKEKPMNMYISDIDEPPLRHSPISFHLHRDVEMVLNLQVIVSADSLRMLSRTQRDCVFRDDGPSYNGCYSDCIKKKFLKSCGCLPWFYNDNKNKIECRDLDRYSCIANNVQYDSCIKNCFLLCDRTSYQFVKLNGSSNIATTTIETWWPQGLLRREVRYGWLDLFVSFGGIMSLFIGYSFLTTIELLYQFSLRLYCGAILDNTMKMNVTKIQVAKKKKPKNSDIIYYDYIE